MRAMIAAGVLALSFASAQADPTADFVNCLRQADARLDDGFSDPYSVGIGLLGSCGPQMAAFRAYTFRAAPYEAAMNANPRFETMVQKTATTVVLQGRARR